MFELEVCCSKYKTVRYIVSNNRTGVGACDMINVFYVCYVYGQGIHVACMCSGCMCSIHLSTYVLVEGFKTETVSARIHGVVYIVCLTMGLLSLIFTYLFLIFLFLILFNKCFDSYDILQCIGTGSTKHHLFFVLVQQYILTTREFKADI